MTVAGHPAPRSDCTAGACLHRFTVAEYGRMKELGILASTDPVELLKGFICIKMDYGPPYEVPVGIPPEVLVEAARLPGVPLRRFTVGEYDRMGEGGVFRPDLRHELAEGWVVDKMVHNPRHDSCVQRLAKSLSRLIGESGKSACSPRYPSMMAGRSRTWRWSLDPWAVMTRTIRCQLTSLFWSRLRTAPWPTTAQ